VNEEVMAGWGAVAQKKPNKLKISSFWAVAGI
jgi:hypothetical protein